MSLILIIWFVLFFISLGVQGIYYLYMRYSATLPWKLQINKSYCPEITILVPLYNEEKLINLKLLNLFNVKYPKEKMQVILINDGSNDNTLNEISKFVNRYPVLPIKILNNDKRIGKVRALNNALEKTKGNIIVVSDADCFWSSDILSKAFSYLINYDIGAVIGHELLLSSKKSWVTKTELAFLDVVHTMRLGESKIHSTFVSQGGFCAYKRRFLDKFDEIADDSGTALNIIQKGARTILVPEVIYYTSFPTKWKNKINIKIRRAKVLIPLMIKSLNLALKNKLLLPRRIALPNIFLYIFNPVIFIVFTITTIFVMIKFQVLIIIFTMIFLLITLNTRIRLLFLELIQNNFILIVAFILFILNQKVIFWKTDEETRSLLSEDILKHNNLI